MAGLIKEPMNTVHILFCGHSHFQILFRKESGCVTREPVPPGLPVILQQNGRYIFILNLLIIRGSRPVAVDALVVLKGK